MSRAFAPAITLTATTILLSGCITINLGRGAHDPLTETVVYGERGPKILMLDIQGVIQEEPEEGTLGMGGRESPVARIREQLRKAEDDDSVKALLLRVHSPGGTATASEIVYQELARFKQKRSIPVVAQFMGVATSGAYYVSMAADFIQAQPTTVTGSIGVIFMGLNLSGLMEKAGVENQTLTSGAFKDSGSPLRPMLDEERAQLQSVVDELHARFREVVVRGRPGLDAESVATLADGRVYSAGQARDAGLIDAIGDLPGAVKQAESRAGLARSRVVVYHRPGEWRENLYSLQARPASAPLDLRALVRPVSGPAFLYLWWPGGS